MSWWKSTMLKDFGIFCLFERFSGTAQNAIEEQIKLIQLADKLGFNEAWIGEHHFNDFSICPNPSLLMASIFAKTENIRVGTAGYLSAFYDPIRLAEEIATLDVLSNKRLNLGFAKGAFAPDSKHFKVTAENLKETMFENISAINEILYSKKATFFGNFVEFEGVDIEPKPLQEKIPTYIATFASTKTIEYAANYNYSLMGSQGLSIDECELMSRCYKSFNGEYPKIVIMRTFYVDDSKEAAKPKVIASVDHFVKSMRAASSFNKSPSFDKENYANITKEREQFFDGQKFVNAAIYGSVDDCIAQIKDIKNKIPNATIALKLAGTDYETNARMLKIFKEQIAPFC